MKRFCYRLTRALLVVNTVLVPSLILDVVVKANQFRGGAGLVEVVGGGLARESCIQAGPPTVFLSPHIGEAETLHEDLHDTRF